MPRRCERRTLPIELIPQACIKCAQPRLGVDPKMVLRVSIPKATLAGLEPATLRFEVLRAIHCATGPLVPVGVEPTPTNVDSNLSRAP